MAISHRKQSTVSDLYSSCYIQHVLISSDSELPIVCCAVERKKNKSLHLQSVLPAVGSFKHM